MYAMAVEYTGIVWWENGVSIFHIQCNGNLDCQSYKQVAIDNIIFPLTLKWTQWTDYIWS